MNTKLHNEDEIMTMIRRSIAEACHVYLCPCFERGKSYKSQETTVNSHTLVLIARVQFLFSYLLPQRVRVHLVSAIFLLMATTICTKHLR